MDEELGKRSLKEKLQRLIRGESNFANMGKLLAEERERLKLAKLLKERRLSGERARTAALVKKRRESAKRSLQER
jgi:hypothetical protein